MGDIGSEPSVDTNVDDELDEADETNVDDKQDEVGETNVDEELNGVDERDRVCNMGDANTVNEPDRADEARACRGGAGSLDTERCQSSFSPDSLFRKVG